MFFAALIVAGCSSTDKEQVTGVEPPPNENPPPQTGVQIRVRNATGNLASCEGYDISEAICQIPGTFQKINFGPVPGASETDYVLLARAPSYPDIDFVVLVDETPITVEWRPPAGPGPLLVDGTYTYVVGGYVCYRSLPDNVIFNLWVSLQKD